ncbi:MAG: methionine ABC transporter ATP-binding protein, partial [Clostridium butyricum]|nr:methionine ABC transporter ATP-binding protein [Clostridium butyricum]
IGIIRSLIYIPEVLLLDESTSALDEKNTKNIEKFIKSLNEEEVTVLWITHSNEQSQSIFNKRIEISNGKIEKVEVIA